MTDSETSASPPCPALKAATADGKAYTWLRWDHEGKQGIVLIGPDEEVTLVMHDDAALELARWIDYQVSHASTLAAELGLGD